MKNKQGELLARAGGDGATIKGSEIGPDTLVYQGQRSTGIGGKIPAKVAHNANLGASCPCLSCQAFRDGIKMSRPESEQWL